MGNRSTRRRRGARRQMLWCGSRFSASPADTVADVHPIYSRVIGSTAGPATVLRTIVRGSIENIDSAQGSLNIGWGIIVSRFFEDESRPTHDPLSSDVDVTRQPWLMLHRENFGASSATNNYWRAIDIDVKGRRKVDQSEELALWVRGSVASDWKYFFDVRVLLAIL